jgi:hypothetical protein
MTFTLTGVKLRKCTFHLYGREAPASAHAAGILFFCCVLLCVLNYYNLLQEYQHMEVKYMFD